MQNICLQSPLSNKTNLYKTNDPSIYSKCLQVPQTHHVVLPQRLILDEQQTFRQVQRVKTPSHSKQLSQNQFQQSTPSFKLCEQSQVNNQTDLECLQQKYETLEKQYTAKLAGELDLVKREKAIKAHQESLLCENSPLIEKLQKIESELTLERSRNLETNLQLQILKQEKLNYEDVLYDQAELLQVSEQNKTLSIKIDNLNQQIVDQMAREKQNQSIQSSLQITLGQYQEEVNSLRLKLDQINSFKYQDKIQEAVKDKKRVDMLLKLKEQEFNALKQVAKDKDIENKTQYDSIQEYQKQVVQLDAEKNNAQQTLENRELLFTQFKIDVQVEVEERIKILVDESLVLRETISQKQIKINQLQTLQPCVEHYQQQFVNSQLTVEILEQKIVEMEDSSKSLQEDYEEQIEKEQNEGLNWKQKFTEMNKQYHIQQEEIYMIKADMQATMIATRDSKFGENVTRRGSQYKNL